MPGVWLPDLETLGRPLLSMEPQILYVYTGVKDTGLYLRQGW